MTNKIIEYLEEKSCSKDQLIKIWNIIYEDWEECPDDKEEALGILIDGISDASLKKIQKIYKILFEEEEEL